MDHEYFRSERFIHDELTRRCEAVVQQTYRHWKESKCIYPTLLLWPMDGVQTSAGESCTGVIFTALPDEARARRKAIEQAAARCAAYALLLTEQLDTDVRIILETKNGTRTWRLPIQRRGDVQVLGRPVIKDNTESIGVNWVTN